MSGTPIYHLASRRLPILAPAWERAREVDDRGQKRAADVDSGELRSLEQAGAQLALDPELFLRRWFMNDANEVVKFADVNEVTRQQLMEWAIGEQHPLLQVQALAGS